MSIISIHPKGMAKSQKSFQRFLMKKQIISGSTVPAEKHIYLKCNEAQDGALASDLV